MRKVVRTLSGLALMLVALIATLPAQTPARQTGPYSPFVGTWILNVGKSTYEGIPPEQRRSPSTRTIDIDVNGLLVETHRNVTGGGRQGFFHWVGKPDGPEIPEFGRNTGTVGNKLTIKTVTDHQWAVTFRNQNGKVVITDTWTVSPDDKTLTIDRRNTPPQGATSHSVEVFDNEGFAMPRPRQ